MAESYDVLLEKAIQAGESREYPEAIGILKKIIIETDNLPQAYLYLGRSYHAMGEYGAAIRAFKQFIVNCPDESAGYFFLGRTYLNLGIFGFSLPWLKKALSLEPGNAHIRSYLGLTYLKLKNPDAAVHHLEKAVEYVPRNRFMYTAYINALTVSAIRTFYRGDIDLARQMFRFILDNGNGNQFIHVYLAEIEFETGNLEESLEQYEKALSFSPEDPFLLFRHARVLYLLGNTASAMQRIAKLRDALPGIGVQEDDLPWRKEKFDVILAIQYFQKGKFRDAIFYGKKILRKNSKNADMHLLMGEAYRNLGDFVKAGNHFNRVLDGDKRNIQARYGLSMILWQQNNFEEMMKELNRILSIDPDDGIAGYYIALCMHKLEYPAKETLLKIQAELHRNGPDIHLFNALGYEYIRSELSDLSAKWFEKSLKLKPDNIEALKGLVDVAILLEDSARLRVSYDKYLLVEPGDAELRRDYIQFLMNQNDYGGATEQILRAIPFEKNDRVFTRLLAICYRKKEDYREASLVYRQLLRREPENVEYLRGLSYCYNKLGNAKNAVFFLERSKNAIDKSPDLLLVYGVLLHKNGDFEKALSIFRKVLDISKDDWRAFKNIGMVYKERGMKEIAEKFLKRAEEYKNKSFSRL